MAVTKAISKDYLVTQLKNFDKEILEGKYIQITDDASYSIKKLGTATEGALATYKLTKTVGDQTVELGDAIDIPKDFLVKSASVKTVVTENDPVEGYKVGDKYIDFIINTKDSEQGSAEDAHVYLLVKDLVDVYTEGDGIDISATNVVSASVNTDAGLKIDENKKIAIDFETENINFSTEWQ